MTENKRTPRQEREAEPAWFRDLEARWQADPAAAPADLRGFLDRRGRPGPVTATKAATAGASARTDEDPADVAACLRLIDAWRARGYLVADYDPLDLAEKPELPELAPAFWGLAASAALPDAVVAEAPALATNGAAPKVADLVQALRRTWAGTLSADAAHVEEAAARRWLEDRVSAPADLSAGDRRWTLNQLTRAEGFENFLQLKYPTRKRFGLEGSEAQLPLVERLFARAADAGVEEVVIGPHHRGRTTFMATAMGKPVAAVIAEFTGATPFPADLPNAGDASYHMGYSGTRQVGGRTLRLSMASHPSHVETVIPVSLGKLRAKQRAAGDPGGDRIIGIMFHTDGGVAGQGVVAETVQLSRVRGFRSGGVVHVTVDNRVAFTTRPEDQRSSRFASDVLKLAGMPILRVNADDPEATVRAADIAFDFRRTFCRDIAIELVCYRRRGHNEMDEPRFTQPSMYAAVDARQPVRHTYRDRLIAEAVLSPGEANELEATCMADYQKANEAAETWRPNAVDTLGGAWSDMAAPDRSATGPNPATGLPLTSLQELGRRINTLPEGMGAHAKIAGQFRDRQATLEAGEGIAWATAEALAFGSLLAEGYSVRLSGEDSQRGTFAQRHATVFDQATEAAHQPLAAVAADGAQFEILDSPLSEMAVLGYEYGYSMAAPDTLVCWEAQFGDFANAAQPMIDQFIAAGMEKWFRQSGLTMLLPHGLEGGGPEHSSARLERFLQLTANNNMSVAFPTTPANYFHLLRRQMLRDYRVPLVVMTPKGLLRHRRAVSPLSAFGPGKSFMPVLPDVRVDPAKVTRHVLCTGRLFYDLLEARAEQGLETVALTRVEELYPFPRTPLTRELDRFGGAEVVWAQEEPLNMGAWSYMDRRLEDILRSLGRARVRPEVVARPENPSPATGYPARHAAEQAAVVDAALGVAGR